MYSINSGHFFQTPQSPVIICSSIRWPLGLYHLMSSYAELQVLVARGGNNWQVQRLARPIPVCKSYVVWPLHPMYGSQFFLCSSASITFVGTLKYGLTHSVMPGGIHGQTIPAVSLGFLVAREVGSPLFIEGMSSLVYCWNFNSLLLESSAVRTFTAVHCWNVDRSLLREFQLWFVVGLSILFH